MKNAFQLPVFVFYEVCEYGRTIAKCAFKSPGTQKFFCLPVSACFVKNSLFILLFKNCQMPA